MRFLAIIAWIGCSSPSHPAPPAPPVRDPVPPELACKVDSDCLLVDIGRVTKPEDCECRGCSANAVNRTTFAGWEQAWLQHCKVDEDGILNGKKVCGIHECLPLEHACRDGRCLMLGLKRK